MPQQLRLRPAVVLVSAVVPPVAVTAAAFGLAALVGPSGVAGAVAFGAVMLLSVPFAWARARRRTLTVSDDGLAVQRDRYRLQVPWDHVTGVARRRHQLLLVVDELQVRDPEILALDSRGRATVLPPGLGAHPATTRIQVSLYDLDWRDGPVGAHLGREGIVTAR
ncbi:MULTISPECIES: hypothetical protein [unclassified Isoptericola]|uniref:hypothetical protein n=1 Tax=unclassified Isoptericola TaxID=2623355 RepID=UPI00364B618B